MTLKLFLKVKKTKRQLERVNFSSFYLLRIIFRGYLFFYDN